MGCQQHLVFPGGHPSKYYPDPTLLNFADRTRSGAFNVVWSLASDIEETKDLNIKLFFFFSQTTSTITTTTTFNISDNSGGGVLFFRTVLFAPTAMQSSTVPYGTVISDNCYFHTDFVIQYYFETQQR